MSIEQQIESGQLVCPVTRQKLSIANDGQWLENADKTQRYRFLGGRVPILLTPVTAGKFSPDQEIMHDIYDPAVKRKTSFVARVKDDLKKYSLPRKINAVLKSDYRTDACDKAFSGLFNGLGSDALCLAVGGGPSRDHPMLCNVNIGPFSDVDVVADAHELPYADECADLITSVAVFEHLHNPLQAAKEMHRVLKPGRKAFIHTPFLQSYHGAPHHYQNYTISGHKQLFEAAGFTIVEAGVGVGPVYTIVNLVTVFINEYFPSFLKKPARYLWFTAGLFIRPLDKILGTRPNAYTLASTTYVVVTK